MKLFLISDNIDAMIGMRLAGIEGVRIKSTEEGEKALDRVLSDREIAVLLVTPGVEKLCSDRLRQLEQSNRPLLVTIPDGEGNRSGDSVTAYIREAIGIQM